MSREVRVLADGFSVLEAPRWKDGKLFVSDFYTHRVLAFEPDGSYETIVEVPNQPSGLGWDLEDRLLIVSMLDRKVLRFADGKLTVYADLDEYCAGPTNDMVVDRLGRAYVGNFGHPDELQPTEIVRIDPDGTTSIAAKDVSFPNGACITPDGKTFLLAETFISRISAFEIADDGSLVKRRAWAKFAEPIETRSLREAASMMPILPDGICLDADGCLWVACAKGDGAYRVSEGGQIIEKVETGEQSVYATMLGGEDRTTLYLCCAPPVFTVDHTTARDGTLLACKVDVPGAGLP